MMKNRERNEILIYEVSVKEINAKMVKREVCGIQ